MEESTYTIFTYFDEDLGMEFELPYFDNVRGDDLRFKYKHQIHRAIYEAIIFLDTSPNYKTAPCFSVNDIIFELDHMSLPEKLESTLAYFIEIEEFEICAKLIIIQKRL